MKKRMRKTGEIVDVITSYNLYTSERNEFDTVSYIDSNGVEHPKEKGLNLWWDFEDIEEETKTENGIDWQQRRYEIAKDILAATYDYPMGGNPYVKIAVSIADDLIAELKKGGEK